MHEMGIANSILEGVGKEMRRHPGCRPRKVGVRIGELAGVDPAALQFAFEVLVLDTELDSLKLEIEYRAARVRCRACSREYEARNFELQCVSCASLDIQCIGGDELEFAFLEVDEDEPCTAGRKSSQ